MSFDAFSNMEKEIMHSHSEQRELQVDCSHYAKSYDTFERWSSYWYQLDAIRRANPKTMLEIGVGTGLTSWYARNRLGINVTTCDFDPDLKPDVVADVRKLSETFDLDSFDLVVAFQVLEHLPFEEFPGCIEQLARVARKNVVISLPCAGWRWGLSVRVRSRVFRFGHTVSRRRTKWSFEKEGDGQHYWEIGVKESTLKNVLKICNQRIPVRKHYFVPEHPYHLFLEMSQS